MSNRTDHKQNRREYLLDNPRCEWRCGYISTEVDHIVQKSGGTYETVENYMAVCPDCHKQKHAENRRTEALLYKMRKGEYFPGAAAEMAAFGKCYLFDARDIA